MQPVSTTRRVVLLGASTVTTAVLAGCLGGDEESFPAYADWVPDDASAEQLDVRVDGRLVVVEYSVTPRG